MLANPKCRLLIRHSDAQKDVKLARQLLDHLRLLERVGGLDVWSESRIRAGAPVREELERAIDQADIALLRG